MVQGSAQPVTVEPNGVAAATGPATSNQWAIVPDGTTVRWHASKKYLLLIPVSVTGAFTGATGTVTVAGDDLTTARVELTVPVASQSSGNARRDTHLRSAAFFDADSHPSITFRGGAIRRAESARDRYVVEGTIHLRGQDRPVTLEGTWRDAPGGRARVELTGTIDRRQFGLDWNGRPMMDLHDRIRLEVEAELEPARS